MGTLKLKKPSDAYLMESDHEAERIESKTDILATNAQLHCVGLKKGMKVLDLGCASGTTTREMAKTVLPEKAVGVDFSEQRILWASSKASKEGIKNAEFVQGSAYELPFKSEHFDMTWSRFLFEYLETPKKALAEMIRVTKTGGKIVVGDLDHNCMNHFPFPEPLRVTWQKALEIAHRDTGFDPYVGRKLFTFFKELGLNDVKVHALNHHNIFGPMNPIDLENWMMKVEAIGKFWDQLFATKAEFEQFKLEMKKLWLRPDRYTYTSLFLVEGIK